jgi:hypothetical protein
MEKAGLETKFNNNKGRGGMKMYMGNNIEMNMSPTARA